MELTALPADGLSEWFLSQSVPAGFTMLQWRQILGHARYSEAVWPARPPVSADPWEQGTAGWEEFLSGHFEQAPPSVSVSARRVNRATFRDLATRHTVQRKAGTLALGELLQVMSRFADDDGCNVYPANSTVAKELGVSRETVNRKIGQAVRDGWLLPDGKRGRTVRYRLAAPLDV